MSPELLRRHLTGGFAVLAIACAGWASTSNEKRQAAAQWIADVCSAESRPMFASAPATGAAARPSTVLTPLSCEPLPNVPGKSITTLIVDFPPLAYSPAHRHPGAVTAVVVQGTVRSQLGGGPVGDYRAGQMFFEPPGTLHLFAENPDPTQPARLISTFVTDADCGPLVLPP